MERSSGFQQRSFYRRAKSTFVTFHLMSNTAIWHSGKKMNVEISWCQSVCVTVTVTVTITWSWWQLTVMILWPWQFRDVTLTKPWLDSYVAILRDYGTVKKCLWQYRDQESPVTWSWLCRDSEGKKCGFGVTGTVPWTWKNVTVTMPWLEPFDRVTMTTYMTIRRYRDRDSTLPWSCHTTLNSGEINVCNDKYLSNILISPARGPTARSTWTCWQPK